MRNCAIIDPLHLKPPVDSCLSEKPAIDTFRELAHLVPRIAFI